MVPPSGNWHKAIHQGKTIPLPPGLLHRHPLRTAPSQPNIKRRQWMVTGRPLSALDRDKPGGDLASGKRPRNAHLIERDRGSPRAAQEQQVTGQRQSSSGRPANPLSEILAGTDAFGVVSGQLLHQALHLLAGSFADRTPWKNASHRENNLIF